MEPDGDLSNEGIYENRYVLQELSTGDRYTTTEERRPFSESQTNDSADVYEVPGSQEPDEFYQALEHTEADSSNEQEPYLTVIHNENSHGADQHCKEFHSGLKQTNHYQAYVLDDNDQESVGQTTEVKTPEKRLKASNNNERKLSKELTKKQAQTPRNMDHVDATGTGHKTQMRMALAIAMLALIIGIAGSILSVLLATDVLDGRTCSCSSEFASLKSRVHQLELKYTTPATSSISISPTQQSAPSRRSSHMTSVLPETTTMPLSSTTVHRSLYQSNNNTTILQTTVV